MSKTVVMVLQEIQVSLENQAEWAGPDTKDLQESVTRRPVREQHLLESPPTPRTIKLDPRLPLPPHLTAPRQGGGSVRREEVMKEEEKTNKHRSLLLFYSNTTQNLVRSGVTENRDKEDVNECENVSVHTGCKINDFLLYKNFVHVVFMSPSFCSPPFGRLSERLTLK